MKKEKVKKRGNGFVCRFIQSVIYGITAIALLVVCIIFVSLSGMSFLDYVKDAALGSRTLKYSDMESALKSSGLIEEYDNENFYGEYKDVGFVCYVNFENEPYLSVTVSGTRKTDNASFTRTIVCEFEEENADAECLTFKNSQSGKSINVKYNVIYDNYDSRIQHYNTMSFVFGGVSAAMILFTVLQFMFTYRGKKHKGANALCIALNTPFVLLYFVGLFGFIGGIKGLKYVKRQQKEAVEEERQNTEQYVPAEENFTEALPAESFALTPCEEAEYIRPKMSVKGKKGIMLALCVLYGLLFLAGVLLAAIPSFANVISGMGICEEISARAYAITIGVMWVALTPSFGYYFATISPYELSKKNKIIIAAVTTAVLVIMNAVFFIIINSVKIEELIPVKEFYETSDSWFIPLSMVFASVAIIICYALTLFKIKPEKIKNEKPVLAEGHNILDMLTYVFKIIVYGVLCLVKAILSFKEKQPDIFILVASVLLTWLAFFAAFVFAIICIAILVTVVILYFAGVMSLASPYNGTYVNADEVGVQTKAYTYTDGNGYTQTIYSWDNKDFYDAGGRYVVSSEDGGKTVKFKSEITEEEREEIKKYIDKK